MNVLVLGSGGREHALAWRIAKSPSCREVFLHPGNAGTKQAGIRSFENTSIDDIEGLVESAKNHDISLVVIGPEVLLDKGYADAFREQQFAVVGPNQLASKIETSKVFAKELMVRANIPTGKYRLVESHADFQKAIKEQNQWPTVLKLDGLAAGKGVCVATGATEAVQFASRIWESQDFGPGPHRLVIEEYLDGTELSYIGLCDGKHFLPLASATDYKRVFEGGRGPNTGGMGCISPSPYFTPALQSKLESQIIQPLMAQLEKEKLDYRGALYVGVMICDGNPYVLEFNARFGDPETQATLLRLESDFVTMLRNTAEGTLGDCPRPIWKTDNAVYVVGAAEGYPGKTTLGDTIAGLEKVPDELEVFYSGVRAEGQQLVTAGGRVLGVGGLGSSLREARQQTYDGLERIHWRGQHFRRDIGA